MKAKWKSVLLFLAGVVLALVAGADIVLSPLFLKAYIQRHWLYSVDAAPLDFRLGGAALLLLALSMALVAALLLPRLPELSRRQALLIAGLGFFLLLPLKNGSFTNSVFFALAGAASVLIWKGTAGRQEQSAGFLAAAWSSVERATTRQWLIFLTVTGFCVYLATAFFLFHLIPHGIDEIAYLFQAKVFARGRLWAPPPPAAEFFHLINLISDRGRWLSQYPPGWPALLTAGVWLGAPWLVNPLLGGLMLGLIYLWARELFGETVARTAGLLALASPYLIMMNSSLMSHTSCAVALLLFLLGFEQGLTRRNPARMLLGTLALGVAVSIRPYTALLVCLPNAIRLALELVRFPRAAIRLALAALIGPVAPLALLFSYNHFTTGDALVFGYEYLYGKTIALGFGPRQFPYPHTLLEGLRIAHARLLMLSENLFQSAVPALFLAGLAPALRQGDRKVLWLGLIFLTLPMGYVFYFFQDYYYEPRFIFESAGALIILCAAGLEAALQKWKDSRGLRHYLLVTIGLALFIFLPAHLLHFRRAGDLGPELKEMVQEQKITHSLIFIEPLYYPMGMMLQSPFLDGDNIYVRQLKGREQEIFSLFPQRPGYQFSYNAKSGQFELTRVADL